MQGYNAYRQVQSQTLSGRDIEYRLLGQVTGALIRARDGEGTLQDKIKAVLWNDKVWNAFMCDLSEEGNALPKELKGKLISLAIWVSKETQLVLDDQIGLDDLIEINKQIIAGLEPRASMAAG